MNFEENPIIINYIENFIIFKNNNIEYKHNSDSYSNDLEIMLNIDVIDEELVEKYDANMIDRLEYYENSINTSSFIDGDLFENENLSSIIYCIIHFELYKNSLYDNLLNYVKDHKDTSLNDFLLRKKFMEKLMYNQYVCRKNVYAMYNNMLLNYDDSASICKDCISLIKENGNVLNL